MEYRNTSNYKNNDPIAFFDSGVGGLTVFKKVKEILPKENCLYFGDTKNMPYGEKTEEQLVEFADRILKFFESKHAKAVVIACLAACLHSDKNYSLWHRRTSFRSIFKTSCF